MAAGYKTGGRKKGATNLRTREVAEKAAREGITPLEVMLREMRYLLAEIEARRPGVKTTEELAALAVVIGEMRELAKSCAPYMHPRLQATEVKGPNDGPLKIEIVRFAT